jgi:phosphatidate cytidylyltransferase
MKGGYYFFGFIVVISSLSLREFYSLARAKGAAPQVIPGLVFGICVEAAFFYHRLQYALLDMLARYGMHVPLPTQSQLVLILFLLFVPLILLVELFRNRGSVFQNVGTTLLGVCYISLFLGACIGVRELFIPGDFPVYRYFDVQGLSVPETVVETIDRWGGLTIVVLFVSIWVCDSAAFFVGRSLGKHKLFERVSPHKTWEGACAGLLGAMAVFVLAKFFVLPYLSLMQALICTLIVGVFGQLGDMVESLMKRDAGVKDSSSMIPGHGGVFDRFDSLIFVSPLIFFYLDFIVF